MRKCPNCGFDLKYTAVTAKMREEHPKAFQLWTREDEDQLAELVARGKNVLEMSRALGRHPASIRKRIALLGLTVQGPELPEDRSYLK